MGRESEGRGGASSKCALTVAAMPPSPGNGDRLVSSRNRLQPKGIYVGTAVDGIAHDHFGGGVGQGGHHGSVGRVGTLWCQGGAEVGEQDAILLTRPVAEQEI